MKKYVACKYAIPSAAYSSAGIMSATTNTLTPTTLGNLEQTFIELQSVPTTSTVQNPMTQSGFVPPVVTLASDPENSYGYGSDSNSSQSGDDYLPSHPKKIRIGDKTTTIMSKFEIENPQRKTHRRQIREEEVTAEEAARRSLRRERNKIAAAKCRQRRVDHTNRLLTETEKLEQEQQAIESEIQALQNEKDQLEFILQTHSQLCKVNGRVPGVKLDFKKDAVELQIKRDPDGPERHRAVTKAETAVTSRPSSLSLSKRDLKDVSGIAITTPSSGFLSFSLDTMVDHTGLTPLTGHLGHTGLTPVTSLPVSCGSEVTKKQSTSSESSDGVKSPPSGLISL